MEGLSAIGILDRPDLADPTSTAFRSGLDQVKAMCGSVPAIVVIATPGDARAQQLEAGRLYAHAALGLAMHPLSQALQEYAEMAPAFARVHALLAAPGERLQMLARIGTADPCRLPSAGRWRRI